MRLIDRKFYNENHWQSEYEIFRYLKNLQDKGLYERHEAILKNMAYLQWCLDEIPIESYLSPWYWKRKLFHTQQELLLRALPTKNYKALVPSSLLTKPKIHQASKPCSTNFLSHYGELKYLKETFKEGKIRIKLASGNNNSQLNAAQQDNEIKKHHYLTNARIEIIRPEGNIEQPFKGDIKHEISLPFDYYMYSMAMDFDWYMFNEFGANACLIVKDVPKFIDRINQAILKVYPRLDPYDFPVQYYDPYEVRTNEKIDPGSSKDFSYALQKEFRLLWLPIKCLHEQLHKYIDLEIGSLQDICELVEFDPKDEKVT